MPPLNTEHELLSIRPWVKDVDTWRKAMEEKGRAERRFMDATDLARRSKDTRKSKEILAALDERKKSSSSSSSRKRTTTTKSSAPREEPLYKRLDEAQLRELYITQNLSMKATAARMGCSTETISRAIDFHGITRHPRRNLPTANLLGEPIDPEEIARLYTEELMSSNDIAERLHISQRRVRAILNRQNVEKRPVRHGLKTAYEEHDVKAIDVRDWCIREGIEVPAAGFPALQYLKMYLASRDAT